MAHEVAQILEHATGAPFSTSMLCYFAASGLVVPESRHKNTANYYRYYQIVMLYICRYLKGYGIPAIKVQQIITTRFYVTIKEAVCAEGQWYVIGGEEVALVTQEKNHAPWGKFFWCLPLLDFKLDIQTAIANLRENGVIEPTPLAEQIID